MNWLAHILISKKSVDYQLGNLLADPLKGKIWPGCSSLVQDGFNMHRSIDVFTDSNGHVKKSKYRLGDKGYLKGVVIDIAYDYLLFKNWEHYASIDAISFLKRFYGEAKHAIANYPKEAREFVERIITHDVLHSFSSLEGLLTAFKRMDSRLSGRMLARETVSGYMPILTTQIQAIEGDFRQFFPQLVAHFRSRSGSSVHEHWFK